MRRIWVAAVLVIVTHGCREAELAHIAPATAIASEAEKKGECAKKIETIARGSKVDVSKHLAKGCVTIVDFYADWCGPCRLIAPHLEKLATENSDIVLRKVDIVTWGTPVTEQYEIYSIPRVDIYGPDAKLVGTVRGVNQQQVEELVKRGKSAAATASTP